MTEELPLPGYDELPLGSLAARIRTLDADGVRRLVEYEKAHADRPAALAVLGRRAAELAAGAEPTGGSPRGWQPERQPARKPASAVTEGPPQNPPSHGDPTNPAQPRD